MKRYEYIIVRLPVGLTDADTHEYMARTLTDWGRLGWRICHMQTLSGFSNFLLEKETGGIDQDLENFLKDRGPGAGPVPLNP